MTTLSQVRSALIEAVSRCDWTVVDEADVPVAWHAPCAMVLKTVSVNVDSFGVRRYAFTVRLLTSAESTRTEYYDLLDAVGTGGYIDQLETELRTTRPEWSTAIPSYSTAIVEEAYGQVLLQQADITVEVWT